MSQDNYILNLLNIEDKNIKLTNNFYKIELKLSDTIKVGRKTTVYFFCLLQYI